MSRAVVAAIEGGHGRPNIFRMKQTFFRRLAPLLVLFGLTIGGPAAAPAQEIGGDGALLRSIEQYFDGFKTLQARFTQYAQDGSTADGMLWLKRPGRFRFEYAPPNDILLVGDGTWLIFYDAAVDQVSHLPLNSGAPRFLTAEKIRFGGDIGVTNIERDNGMIAVTVVDRTEPGSGSLTMRFEENPMVLREWTVMDAQGQATRVVLRDIQYGPDLDNDFFYFTDHDRKKDFRVGTYQ
ncbi:MAG: hypothetical protein CMM50_03135 [Rhodospirillaceae bacterium]|nr:hypothetical protein [Rhodospirillaceae bacterium]|tara:strand:- start:768 stop:1478 length:711 start_codon:yes stop_codon:yes gene_type:complete